jgi:glycosyltransferase involved in cell wall biosynthesis
MTADTLLTSVIIANYNSGEKLLRTWESLRDQSATFEVLILDGNSKDGSRELAERLREGDARIRVWSGKDRGVYDAMNKGIAHARGRFLYFMGAGDEVLPGAFSELAPALAVDRPTLVYGDVLLNGEAFAGRFDLNKICRMNVCHQAVFYHRRVFELLGTYSLKYRALADWAFNIQCFSDERIETCYVPVVICIYEGGGLSDAGDPAFYKDLNRLILKHGGFVALARNSKHWVFEGARSLFRTGQRIIKKSACSK